MTARATTGAPARRHCGGRCRRCSPSRSGAPSFVGSQRRIQPRRRCRAPPPSRRRRLIAARPLPTEAERWGLVSTPSGGCPVGHRHRLAHDRRRRLDVGSVWYHDGSHLASDPADHRSWTVGNVYEDTRAADGGVAADRQRTPRPADTGPTVDELVAALDAQENTDASRMSPPMSLSWVGTAASGSPLNGSRSVRNDLLHWGRRPTAHVGLSRAASRGGGWSPDTQ